MLASGALFIGALAPGAAAHLAETIRLFIERPHAIAIDPLGPPLQTLLAALGWALLPAVLLFLVAALASGLIQHGPIWTAAPLAPKLERISPVAGAKRLFALGSLVEFVKGLLKIILVGAAAILLLWPAAPRVLTAVEVEAGPLLALLHALAVRLLLGVAALTALVAILDSLYQRFERHKQLRMSRRDLQDEFKQTEGDPFIKARLRSLRMERARRRMMAEVPNATVLVTSPTHVAIALRYDPTMAAPRLVAKGMGALAERIRATARAHGVPIVRNPPLARAACRRRAGRRGAARPLPRGRGGDRLRAAPQRAPLTYRRTHPPAPARPPRNGSFTAPSLRLGPTKRLRSRRQTR